LSANDRKLPSLDLLALPIAANVGITRDAAGFSVTAPWALAEFGVLPLKAGWWLLECEGDAGALEVQLSNASDPLIVFDGDKAASLRIRVAEQSSFRVTLMVSPWPGAYAFRALRLRRVGAAEETGVLAGAAVRLLRRDQPLKRIRNVLGRLASGQPVGVGSAGAEPAVRASIVPPQAEGPCKGQVRDENGICAHLLEGDELHPQALEIVRREFAGDHGAQAIYADALEDGTLLPRPEWDPVLASHANYTGHPIFFREPVPAGEGFAHVVALAREGGARRIALPLVRRAVTERRPVAPPPVPALPRWPRVSVLIPTKFRIDLLEKCLTGLAERTDYPDLEVIVIDNGSTDPRLPEVIKHAAARLTVKHIVDARPFNYPQLNNTGAAISSGEIMLLLNDDVEAIESGWLKRIVASVMEDGVGAVGARLLYPDRTIQHAGVILGLGGVCGHQWKGLTEPEAAMIPEVVLPGTRLAVTAACLAVRRQIYDQVGGLDQSLGVALNDIDLCMRLHASGLRNIYRGDAVLIHHESQSRGSDDAKVEKRRRLARETAIFLSRWGKMIDSDPFGSPAFNPASQNGDIRRSLLRAWN
jgi:GT2 family glycosyltransferase